MRSVITEVLQHTLPRVNEMEDLVLKDIKIALSMVEQTCGRYILSKSIVTNYMNTANVSKELIKKMIAKMPVSGWVTSNPFYNLLSIYLVTFLASNKAETAIATARLYSAITCSYLKAKYFPICNEEVLKYTISQMHGASVVKQGFTTLCIKVADATLYKYLDDMVNSLNKYAFYRYIVDIRNKLNQSMKIIAIAYYNIQSEERSKSYEDLAERINNNIINIASSENIINYIAKENNISNIEVENVCVPLLDHVDATLIMQTLVLELLTLYNGPEGIEKIGMSSVVNRAYRTESIIKIIKNICNTIEQPITIINVKVILYLGVLLILSYR